MLVCMQSSTLPPELAAEFSTGEAVLLGITPQRLRGDDLERPFRGVRMRKDSAPLEGNLYEKAKHRELSLIRALGNRLVLGQFLSHRSAAMIWEAPVPNRRELDLHVTAFVPQRIPRIQGVRGHNVEPSRARVVERDGLQIASPETVFASSGALPLTELVALGDYFVRKHRVGVGRRNVGKPPLTTIEQCTEAVNLGRWRGMTRLRHALTLLREDSWSPMESVTRVGLISAGLPEPELNVDLFDKHGSFLGCLDMVYRRYKVAVEYQGGQHGDRYAEDVERYEALHAAGWRVIQVTKVLAARPAVMTARVGDALRKRGWNGVA